MEWSDTGIVLTAKKHGETSAIVTLLTKHHGRHAGLVRGGSRKRIQGILQPGNLVDVRWRARLIEHLGAFSLDLVTSYGTPLLLSPGPVAALTSACALSEAALPERQPNQPIFDGLNFLLQSLIEEYWPKIYVKWELGLLSELGFGLDFSKCGATGEKFDLKYVSPKSGRAVSESAAKPYKDRLLPLPPFLINSDAAPKAPEMVQALILTGYFLENHVFSQRPGGMPNARQRLTDIFS